MTMIPTDGGYAADDEMAGGGIGHGLSKMNKHSVILLINAPNRTLPMQPPVSLVILTCNRLSS